MAVINTLLAFCIVLATASNPVANAAPPMSFQEWVFSQQSSAITDITEALNVSTA